MSPVIVLAILVTANDAGTDTVRAMRVAAAEALGSDTLVAVEVENLLSDRVALRAEERMRAAAVVQLAWVDQARSHAHLRLHVAETDAWIERTLTFSPADTEPERGRTLGFAVTSMLPEEVLAARSRILLPRADEAAAPAAAPPPAPSAAPAPPAPQRYAVRLAAAGSTGVSGTAGGIGGTVDGELFFGAAPSLRAGIGFRFGNVPGLDSDVTLSLRGGFALWPVPLSAGWPVAVSVRVDGVAFRHDLSFRSEDGRVTRLGRWVAGMDVVAELSIRLAATMQLVAAAGAEVAFGATDLVIQDIYPPDRVSERTVATIPPLRGVGELGLRLLF